MLVCLSDRTHLVLTQEASTALIRRLRKPPLSMTCRAWMVAPPGEHTLSLSWPGCCSESNSIRAAPLKETWGKGNPHQTHTILIMSCPACVFVQHTLYCLQTPGNILSGCMDFTGIVYVKLHMFTPEGVKWP